MMVHGLVWDDEGDPQGNVVHIARHGVFVWEVREVLESAPVFLEAEESLGPNPVFVAIGYTAAGRLLEVWGIQFEKPAAQGLVANGDGDGCPSTLPTDPPERAR